MARIELKNTVIKLKDGLSGTGAINEPTTAPVATDTQFDIDTLVLNTTVTDQVPIGARFTVAGETASTTVHTVTARTPTVGGTTTNIVFSPALGAGTYADGGVVTFTNQEITIKIGDGNLTYTEQNEYNYDLDRGALDTVRAGDQVPMEVSLAFIYEWITTGTNESITPMDAIKQKGGASEWVTSSSDPCEPYSVDVEVIYTPYCSSADIETTLFPEFRSESREVDFGEANISVTGRCNAVEPTVTRG
jgi:hypothetical protein